MDIAIRYEIAYTEDSSALFARVAFRPWAIYLDSGRPKSPYGRYDIIVADPFCTIVTEGAQTSITRDAHLETSNQDPFDILKKCMADYHSAQCEIPFTGGAVGYFGYDLGRRIEQLPDSGSVPESIPQMMVGIYDWALIVDHTLRQAYLVTHFKHQQTRSLWPSICALFEAKFDAQETDFRVTSEVVSNMSEFAYQNAFDRVKAYIQAGDCYQVNLAQRFCVSAEGEGWGAFQHLRQISPAPFLAYMNFPRVQIISGSPERFIQVKGTHVETRPIKGTRPRSEDMQRDKRNAEELLRSTKDRAENLMIVDLLRNDIGKTCKIGTVRVEKLFSLESFSNVHHLVSTIVGRLAKGVTALDVLRGCFPGGSITGAPKLRSMEIIEELEPNKRGLYCGAIGYIGFDGNMDTSIAIRTAIYSNGSFRFWAGGGIVADSECEKEYRETWDKASSMLALVESKKFKQE